MGKTITYLEFFAMYPEKWLVIQPAIRRGYSVLKGKVLKASDSKEEVFEYSKELKQLGYDVVIIPTFESDFECTDEKKEELCTPQEYAYMFNLYYGLPCIT